MTEKFAAIILAAGESRRMGEPKQLLPWGDVTIIEQMVGTFASAAIDELVVVLGHRAAEIGAVVNAYFKALADDWAEWGIYRAVTVQTPLNSNYQSGEMLSSIQCGLGQLSPLVRGAFIVPCDQPQLKSATVNRLRHEFEQAGKGIVVPSYQMRRGHPLLLDVQKYRDEILAIDGAPGLQKILRDHPDDILHVVFDEPGVLADLDTKEDYARAVKK